MDKSNALKKVLIVEIIVLFLAISFIPSTAASEAKTGDMPVEHTMSKSFTSLGRGNGPAPAVFGTMGENGWYISYVTVAFAYNPEEVLEIHYSINGGTWQQYYDEFTVSEDGTYNIEWYWIDREGKRHDEPDFRFKIDQTPPTIELKKKSGSGDQVTFTATVNDPTSGVERVEFYLDDELQDTVYEEPYQWTWTGTTSHSVYAIVYDYAGHSEKSETLSTPYNLFYGNSVVYILKTPGFQSGIGALSEAEMPRPSTILVSTGSIIPSSQIRAVL